MAAPRFANSDPEVLSVRNYHANNYPRVFRVYLYVRCLAVLDDFMKTEDNLEHRYRPDVNR